MQNYNEQNIEKTISISKPPIFWKEKDLVKQQINIWSLTKNSKFINKIQ